MPLRNEALMKPPVIVRKKRPSTLTATTLPAGTAPKPVQPQRGRQLPPSTAPTPEPPAPTTTAQTSADQQHHQQPLLHQWRRERDEFLALLRTRWPQAFPTDIRLVKPHDLGIHREILQMFPKVKRCVLNATLHFYKRWGKGAYWRVVAKGGPRYNLDGTPNGEVTEQEKEHARRALSALVGRGKAQRAGQDTPASLPTTPTA